jgi:hypothetical protein
MPLFYIGEWVDVDPDNRVGRRNSTGGRAIINTNDPTYSVSYILDNHLSQDVDESRIHHSSLMTTSRRLSPEGDVVPSLLSYNYQDHQRARVNVESSSSNDSSLRLQQDLDTIITTSSLLQMSLKYFKGNLKNRQTENPAFLLLSDKMDVELPGWLRRNQSASGKGSVINLKSFLSND